MTRRPFFAVLSTLSLVASHVLLRLRFLPRRLHRRR